MEASTKKSKSSGSSRKRSEKAKPPDPEDLFEEDQNEENSEDGEESPEFEIPEDESKLSPDEKAGRITQIYSGPIKRVWLAVYLWVLLNVFNNDLTEVRSKNPRKEKSFNKIVESEKLHPDLRGPVLRRWVVAGTTWQELDNEGLNTDRVEYSHCREIAKVPTLKGRISVGKRVIEESLTVKETIEAVKAEIAKGKPPATSTDTGLCPLAQTVIQRLDDPVFLSEDPDFCEILLDSVQVRTEFNFREQSKIYDKAEKIKKQRIREKSDLEHRLEGLQQSINFLEDLMNTFDGKEVDSETAA